MKKQKKIDLGKQLQKLAQPGCYFKTTPTGIESSTTGAALTTPELNKEILKPDFLEGTIYDRCKHLPVQDGHQAMLVPKALQTSRTISSGILGGMVTNLVGEDVNISNSAPAFSSDMLTLHKLAILVPATDEIIQDAPFLAKYLHDSFTEGFRYNVDYMILYGNASGTTTTAEGTVVAPSCNGVLNSGNASTYFVTVGGTLAFADLENMLDHYYGGKAGCWCMNQYMVNQVVRLATATGNYQAIKWHKLDEKDEELTLYLFGYPVLRKDNMEQLDILLGDFSCFVVPEISVREDVSSEVFFVQYQSLYRMLYRFNGESLWTAGIALEDGNYVYPFVACAHANQNPQGSNSVSQGFTMVIPKVNTALPKVNTALPKAKK
jgi:HK97 family phage major capsid protein